VYDAVNGMNVVSLSLNILSKISKHTLTTLTEWHSQRVEVVKCFKNSDTQSSLAVKFNIGQAVISMINRDKNKDFF